MDVEGVRTLANRAIYDMKMAQRRLKLLLEKLPEGADLDYVNTLGENLEGAKDELDRRFLQPTA